MGEATTWDRSSKDLAALADPDFDAAVALAAFGREVGRDGERAAETDDGVDLDAARGELRRHRLGTLL